MTGAGQQARYKGEAKEDHVHTKICKLEELVGWNIVLMTTI